MAEVIRYVDKDATGSGTGVDWANAYPTMTQWNTGEATNLVTDGDWHHVYCRASSGTADTNTVGLEAWTTGVANNIVIEAADGDQALKTGWDTSRYRLATTGRSITINIGFVTLKGLQISTSSTTLQAVFATGDTGSSESYINSCRVIGGGGTSVAIYLNTFGGTVNWYVYNTIITDAGIGLFRADGTIYSYNNITEGCTTGHDGTITAVNTVSFNNTNDFNIGSQDFCASDDNDGTNPVTPSGGGVDWPDDFVDAGAGDFTLKGTSNLVDAGADNPSSGLYTTDMEGDAYNVGGYSVGVDEFVSVVTDVFFEMLSQIEQGIKPLTAAGLGGVLQE